MRFGLVLRGRKPPAVGVTDFTNVTFARSLMEGMADGTQAWPAQRMKYLVFTIQVGWRPPTCRDLCVGHPIFRSIGLKANQRAVTDECFSKW